MVFRQLPIGSSDFASIIESGSCYIDKTAAISQLVRDGSSCLLFTRPRRFGKTTFQSMLSSFFDIRRDSRKLFEGLAVMEDQLAVASWMNSCPVISISFRTISGDSFAEDMERMAQIVSDLFLSYDFLLKDDIAPVHRKLFEKACNRECEKGELAESLKILARLLCAHYGKRVILLIDEYDVPLDKANGGGYYKEMLSFVRDMFSYVLKDNSDILKSVLTGCLRVSKESLFTGVNNLKTCTITSNQYSTAFGFTQEEVDRLLSDYNLSDKRDIYSKWYDGYTFGKSENIYSPWDVLRYTDTLLTDRDACPENYWLNTSSDDAIRHLISIAPAAARGDLEALISGQPLYRKICENLTYGEIYNSADNLWSLLFETGYLTFSGIWNENEPICIRIPNEEIRQIFIRCADRWFADEIRKKDLGCFYEAIWSRDAKEIGNTISDLLSQSISYFDYSEAFYHAFVTGLMSTSPYVVQSNRENGLGRSDLMIQDVKNHRSAIVEFKVAASEEEVPKVAAKALAQIDEKHYEGNLKEYRVEKLAVVFFRKSAWAYFA